MLFWKYIEIASMWSIDTYRITLDQSAETKLKHKVMGISQKRFLLQAKQTPMVRMWAETWNTI